MIEIKNKNGEVIYRHEGETLVGADLTDVNLSNADLEGVDLRDANSLGALGIFR